MTNEKHTQPNKPGGDLKPDSDPRAVEDRQAVRNQASVTPDDYPQGSNGKPESPTRQD